MNCLFLWISKFVSNQGLKIIKPDLISNQADDVNLYFKNIEEVSEFKQQDSDEYEESEENMIQVFTAKPDKFRKDRIFNFLPKEIMFAPENNKYGHNLGSSYNPFLWEAPLDQIDSGATPLFKLKKKVEENEGNLKLTKLCLEHWLDANVKADFDKSERYLYEFFNHKDYYKFKEEYSKTLCQVPP